MEGIQLIFQAHLSGGRGGSATEYMHKYSKCLDRYLWGQWGGGGLIPLTSPRKYTTLLNA